MRIHGIIISIFVTSAAANAASTTAMVGIEPGKMANALPNQGLESSYEGVGGIATELFNSVSQPGTCTQTVRPLKFSNLGTGDWGLATGRFIGRALPPGTNSASIAAGRVDTDKSCYLAGPNPLNAANQSATISPLRLDVVPVNRQAVQYLGFYWGSIDPYQSVSFFDKQGNTILFGNVAGSVGTGTVSGQDVINLFGLGLAESRFIDFTFNASDNFGYALFTSSRRAFELDNIAYGTNNPIPPARSPRIFFAVPEAGLAGLLGLASASLMLARGRRRRA